MASGVSRPKKSAPQRNGRPVNIYLGDDDIKRVRDLAAWLVAKGHRVSDSQVIKCALILADTGKDLERAYEQVFAKDLRYRHDN
jgi:hypothetical protein